MIGFLGVDHVSVPESAIIRSQEFLRAVGRTGREGLVVWAGTRDGNIFVVSDAIVPEQRGIRTADGVCVVVEGPAIARLNADLYKHRLQMIAQVHSHPGLAYHSTTDDDYAIATKVGCLSLVVPNFAVMPFSLSNCAVYRLSPDGRWEELPTERILRLISIRKG